jgi:hypothetical protein
MQLVTSELLNPCHFTHLIAWDVQLQSRIVLRTRIFLFFIIMKFHISNLGMICKMHAILT